MSHRRIIAAALLLLLIGGIWRLVSLNDEQGRLTTASTLELWSDLIRDIDHFGLRFTRLSDQEEMAFGDKLAATMQKRVVDDDKLQKYVSGVASALTPFVRRKGIVYKFHIVDMGVINAFAIPGGHIYITRPMLDFLETEAELAAILGHEITHVDMRHCIERFQYQLQLERILPGQLADLTGLVHRLLAIGYSKQEEHEADVGGLALIGNADYHPKHALSFDDRIGDVQGAASGKRKPARFITQELASAVFVGLEDYMASHPPWSERIDQMYVALVKRDGGWRGRKFYVGRSNHTDRISRAEDRRSSEWAPYEEPPAFSLYRGEDKNESFKAFAAHLRSGLSAPARMELTPSRAAEVALSECEKKMKPCQLYAIGGSIVLGESALEIERKKTANFIDVCKQDPPERLIESCKSAAIAQ